MSKKESEEIHKFPNEFKLFDIFFENHFLRGGFIGFDDQADKKRFEDRTMRMIHRFFKWLFLAGLHIRPGKDTSGLVDRLNFEVAILEKSKKRFEKEYEDRLGSMQETIEELEKDGKQQEQLIYVLRKENRDLRVRLLIL